jgi:iron complex transport system substrate-binding protein
MRIVSLLPSLTELVCALSRGDELVGVTHECDYPPGVERIRHLTRSRIAAAAASAQINALVSQQEGSLYELDDAALAELEPDLILTQNQCDVCAVSESSVRAAAERLAGAPHVASVNPMTLGDVFAMFRRIADLLGRATEAENLIGRFESIAQEISWRRAAAQGPETPGRTTVVLLEWLDPPYSAGHWNPELVELAGGHELLGSCGAKSRVLTWDDIVTSQPDVIVVAPCGYALESARDDVEALHGRAEWRALRAVRNGRVAVVDGSAYFARPGPRLVTSLGIAAAAIHPESCLDLAPPPGDGWQFYPPLN